MKQWLVLRWWLCLSNRSFLLSLFAKPSKYSVCNMTLKVRSHVTSAFAFFFGPCCAVLPMQTLQIPTFVAIDPILKFGRWRKRKRIRYVWRRFFKLIERPGSNLIKRMSDSQFIYKRFRWRRVSRLVLRTWRISFTILQSWSTIDAINMVNVQVQKRNIIIWWPTQELFYIHLK